MFVFRILVQNNEKTTSAVFNVVYFSSFVNKKNPVAIDMPLSEGRPNEQWPRRALGEPSQGDMFLCRECEEFRFPYLRVVAPKQNDKDADKPQSNMRITTRSTSRSDHTVKQNTADIKTGQRSAAPSGVSCKTAEESDATLTDCPECHEHIDRSCVACDICSNHFHQHCTGLSTDTFNILMSIVTECGWVCYNCRSTGKGKLGDLRSSLARNNEVVADVRSMVSQLKLDVDNLKSQCMHKFADIDNCLSSENQPGSISVNHGVHLKNEATNQPSVQLESTSSVANKVCKAPDLTTAIYRTLSDVNRRKRNIVVSGLTENECDVNHNTDETDDPDRAMFLALCEEHFSVKPVLSRVGCRRLGRRVDGQQQPRKLLVHLESEQSASTLLQEARKLRKSNNAHVANNVYLNPDLSPAELKLAYDRRQKRRRPILQQSPQQTDNNQTEIQNVLSENISSLNDQSTNNNHEAEATNTPPTTTSGAANLETYDSIPAACLDANTVPGIHRSYTVVHSSFRNK